MTEKNTNMEKNINWNMQDQPVDDLLSELEDESGIKSIKKVRKKTKLSLKTKLLWCLAGLLGFFLLILIGGYYFLKLSTQPFNKLNNYEKQYIEIISNLLEMISQKASNTVTISSALDKTPILQSEQIYSYVKNPWVIFYHKLSFKNRFESNSLKEINNLREKYNKTSFKINWQINQSKNIITKDVYNKKFE